MHEDKNGEGRKKELRTQRQNLFPSSGPMRNPALAKVMRVMAGWKGVPGLLCSPTYVGGLHVIGGECRSTIMGYVIWKCSGDVSCVLFHDKGAEGE